MLASLSVYNARVIYIQNRWDILSEFSPNSIWAISTGKILHTYEMLTCMNDLTRLSNVLVARWCLEAEMTSQFDFPIPILYRRSLKFFVYLLPFKSYSSVLIWLEIWHLDSKIWRFRGALTPKCNERDLQKVSPYSKPRRLSHRACKSVKPFEL
jgi:hypothetical protein